MQFGLRNMTPYQSYSCKLSGTTKPNANSAQASTPSANNAAKTKTKNNNTNTAKRKIDDKKKKNGSTGVKRKRTNNSAKKKEKQKQNNNEHDADGKTTISDDVVADMQARMNKAKAAAGPILVDPTSLLENANKDVDQLTNMTHLQQELVRLQSRTKAVRERMAHLKATASQPGGKRVRTRKLCTREGCTSVAQKGGVCKLHGALVSHKMCTFEGCARQAQRGGVCYTHGAKYKLCRVEGCENKVQQGGVCCRHGAKVKKCSAEGCDVKAQKGGLCHGHNKELSMYHEQLGLGQVEVPEEENNVVVEELQEVQVEDMPYAC